MLHEELRDAALACGAVDEELCDLGTVRLVRWQGEDYLNRADQPTLGKRTKKQPPAVLDLGGEGFECGSRLLV
jgi:hypothetical protein